MEFELDILGQQPLLNLYTQITLAYPIAHDEEACHSAIVTTLNTGLHRLFSSFPWLAGQVVQQGASESSSGVFKIVPFPEHEPLVVKDLCNDPLIPTFATLRTTKFPYSAAVLDESYLAPRRTIPGDPHEPASRPTFLVQATFIRGGLLLTFVAHHMTMDMVGQGQVMSLLSKACHNEPFTDDELAIGNMSRRQLIPLLDSGDMAAFEHLIAKPVPTTAVSSATNEKAALPPPQPPKSSWVYFSFDASSLTALKAYASQTVPSGFISTDDALNALIWQATMRARLPRLTSPNAATYDKFTFSRAVDMRRFMGLPETYPGLYQSLSYATAPTAQEVAEQPLGGLAWQLRQTLDSENLVHQTRGLATLIHQAMDKDRTGISMTATMDASKDVMFSSWSKVDQCCRLTFGMGLGTPVAIRRPKLVPVEGLMYLMPKSAEGEIAAAICLRDEDLDRLRQDTEFLKYAQYIG
ncbi:hypothetical protein BGZ73_004224 [Actinomortierella ambigua]|nr:hypothetical protein BGZ73_004224 [Actinomortierella ambigua]